MMDALEKQERVPEYYFNAPESQAIIETMTTASLAAKAAVEDVLNQFFIDTATWGLDFWEAQVGLETDMTQSDAVRRTAIQKQMMASGNTTEEMVRELAESMTGYKARVIVNKDYSFSLEFLGETTVLADIDVSRVRAVVEQIKPAHLRFVISGLTWSDLESIGLPWRWFADEGITWREFEAKFCVHGKGKAHSIQKEQKGEMFHETNGEARSASF